MTKNEINISVTTQKYYIKLSKKKYSRQQQFAFSLHSKNSSAYFTADSTALPLETEFWLVTTGTAVYLLWQVHSNCTTTSRDKRLSPVIH